MDREHRIIFLSGCKDQPCPKLVLTAFLLNAAGPVFGAFRRVALITPGAEKWNQRPGPSLPCMNPSFRENRRPTEVSGPEEAR